MKLVGTLFLCVFSTSVFASLICDTYLDEVRLYVEVDRPSYSGQRYVSARASIYGEHDDETVYFNAYIDPNSSRFHEFKLSDRGFDLSLNHWPDRFPVIGKTYFADIDVEDLGVDEMNVFCTFNR
ncbi:hypothetical protein N9B72_01725 [Bacteriovoracaceae bacterium]|nr:hypothetical protein [Bacteriovoracaceae bacterium]